MVCSTAAYCDFAYIVGFIWLIYRSAKGSNRMPVWLAFSVLVLLVAYTLFTGATPSVVRAAVMGVVLLLAPIVGRRYDPIAALAVAAFAMTLHDPDLLADTGFQLSFGAMVGVGLLAAPLYDALKSRHVPAVLALSLATSIGAQVMTLPLVALFYGQISVVSLLATQMVELTLLPLMILGILTGIVGTVLVPLAAVLGAATWLCAAWMVWCVNLWSSIPWASINLENVSLAWVAAYYLLLGVALKMLAVLRHNQPGVAAAQSGWHKALLPLGALALGLWMVLIFVTLAK